MIAIDKLRVRLGGVQILHGLEVQVPPARLTTVIGANGAGKTTLLRAISGLISSEGQIALDGTSISGRPAHLIARSGVAHVPQGRQVVPTLSVRDNLLLGAGKVPGRPQAETVSLIEAQYHRFPVLRQRQSVAGGALSGGEQQMLAVARALMMNPRYLLLDEPSLGLAPQIARAILVSLRELADAGMGVLLVEQAAMLALQYSDFGYVMQRGTVVMQDDADRLLQSRELVKRYLG